MKLRIKVSFAKRMFNLYLVLLVSVFLIHEIITNRGLIKREVLFAKDFHNITSTVIDAGYIVYTGLMIKNSLFLSNNFAISMTASLLFIEILKNFLEKERPDKSDKKSFPSGHTAIAIVCFFWLFLFTGKNYLFIIFPIIIGTLRILAKKHDIIDVVGGASISFLICFLTYKISIFITNSRAKNFVEFY